MLTGLVHFSYIFLYPHSPISELANRPVRKYSDDYVSEKLRVLSDVFRRARERQLESMREYKRYYDRRYRAKDEEYRPGDRVWCKNFVPRQKRMIHGSDPI